MPAFPVIGSSVSVTSTGLVSYQQIVNSLGSYIYKIKSIYIQSASAAQMSFPLQFTTYDATGNIISEVQSPVLNLFTKGLCITWDVAPLNIILDGQTVLNTTVLPATGVILLFDLDQYCITDRINKKRNAVISTSRQ